MLLTLVGNKNKLRFVFNEHKNEDGSINSYVSDNNSSIVDGNASEVPNENNKTKASRLYLATLGVTIVAI